MNENVKSKIVQLSDGKPGAINVLCVTVSSLHNDDANFVLDKLIDADITGSGIYTFFKDKCDGQTITFINRIRSMTV